MRKEWTAGCMGFFEGKIEKPDDDKLVALAGVPTSRDGNVYEVHN
jgi:hypothetical protein